MSSPLDKYALPGLVTMAGIAQCGFMAQAVGKARHEHKVAPPATTGPPEFNRIFRAQQNHMEFYPLAVGSLWMGSVFFHPVPSSLLYAGFLMARQRYFVGYSEDSDKKGQGFMISIKILRILIILGLIGASHKVLRHVTGVDVLEKLHEVLPECSN